MNDNRPLRPTPTDDALTRRYADFASLADAVDYAAKGDLGLNFYSPRGELAQVLTYHDLRAGAVRVASGLIARGFKPGDRLALLAQTSAEFVIFFVGAQYASVLPVPLPLPTSFGGRDGYVQQLRKQLQSCQASGFLAPADMADFAYDAAAGLDLDLVGDFAGFLADYGDAPERLRPSGTDDLAYLQYSSGSTRFPHGVAVTNASLMANCHGMGFEGAQLRDGDRNMNWLPFYHDMGLVGAFLTPLTNQVSSDYIATEDFARRPLLWVQLISRNGGTVSYSPTFGYDICARRAARGVPEDLDLSGWRVAGIGGDMVRADVMRRFVEVFSAAGFSNGQFVPSYGLAECTLAVSFVPLGMGISVDKVPENLLAGDTVDPSPAAVPVNGHKINGHEQRLRDVVNCGKPLKEYDVEIRTPDGAVVGDGVIGGVFLRGHSVMKEYFNDHEATAAVIDNRGFLNTGDMGYMRDGYLYIVGRVKDLIIVNGRNHWPQDLEWAAEKVDGLRAGDIAAISIPGEAEEEVPLILVQCRHREPSRRTRLAQQVRREVYDSTGISCRIELVGPRSLPRTSSGKLSRSKARLQYLSGAIAGEAVA